MCGIAGAFSYSPASPPVEIDRLIAMRDWMARRGPDGSGLWRSPDRSIALAHRRLSVIDLTEMGTQPMHSADGRYVISFNGEIYNFIELRTRLISHGYRLRTNSDTEILPYLYDLHGLEMFRHLRGMYAFALWDMKERELILARDPLGIKPLYIADDGKICWFSSQVRPLLTFADIDKSEDPAGHVGYFLWGHVPEPYTLFRNIRSLPSGHYLRLKWNNRKTICSHSSPPSFPAANRIVAAEQSRQFGDSLESLRKLLRETVTYHLVSDVPVGLFLSAGRDSTTLLAIIREVTNGRVHTCTVGFAEFAGTEKDETELAGKVALQYGADHHEIRVSTAERERSIDTFLSAMDQPTIDGFNTFLVSRAAKGQGLKVAMSGVGADEVFGGYSSFRSIPKLVRALRPFRLTPGLGAAFRFVAAPLIRHKLNPKYASIVEFGSTYGDAYLLRRGMFLPWELPSILDPELVRTGMEELQPLTSLAAVANSTKHNPREALMKLEFDCYLRNQLLRDSDWTSMHSSLELRTPFVDSFFVNGIAQHAARFGWPSKDLMAATPSVALPDSIHRRSKSGFSVPFSYSEDQNRVAGELPHRTWARRVYHNYLLSLQ